VRANSSATVRPEDAGRAAPTLRARRDVAARSFSSLLSGARRTPTSRAAQSTDTVDAYEAGRYADMINDAGAKYGVDPTLIAAVTKAESGFNSRAVSHAGAKGLMQLMDSTAKTLGIDNSFDPAANVDGGTRFLSEMLRKFKKPELALAAYNAGPGAVTKFGGVPPYQETQTYVRRVLDLQREMKAT
jgi:soluble lytic murein transglycosylase-like protein